MLFALGQPATFLGLLLAFLLALGIRALAIRLTARLVGIAPRREPVSPRPREDVDPFGAVGAALGGTGWGRTIEVDELPRHRGRGRAAAVIAAGPLAVFVIALLTLTGFFLAYSGVALPSEVLRGAIDGDLAPEFLLALGTGLLSFALLALLPLPPLDGFGLLWFAFRRPGPALTWMRLWFGEKNIGVAVLLLFMLFPQAYPLVHIVIDALAAPLMRVWQ